MTGFLLRLMGVAVLFCTAMIAATLLVSYGLPQEDKIVFDRTSVSAGSQDTNIYRISINRHIDVVLTHDPSKEWQASWSHDGQKIAFVSESPTGSGLYMMDANGQNNHALVNDLYEIKNPIWSPDDHYIAYISDADYPQLRLLDVQTGDIQTLTDSIYAPGDPVWSPDGTQIAFASDMPLADETNIFSIDVRSRKITLLAISNKFNMSPAWSADGTQVFFVSYARENQQFYIFSIDVQTKLLRLLLTGATTPVMSPDGRYLLYENRDQSSLNLLDLNDGKTFFLYQDSIGALSTPDWSPDGQSMVYVSYRPESTNIYRLNVIQCLHQPDDCMLEQVTNRGISGNPRWRPKQP